MYCLIAILFLSFSRHCRIEFERWEDIHEMIFEYPLKIDDSRDFIMIRKNSTRNSYKFLKKIFEKSEESSFQLNFSRFQKWHVLQRAFNSTRILKFHSFKFLKKVFWKNSRSRVPHPSSRERKDRRWIESSSSRPICSRFKPVEIRRHDCATDLDKRRGRGRRFVIRPWREI